MSAQSKPTGVAQCCSYFAILGVGENLVYKHTQKEQSYGDEQESGGTEADDENERIAEQERFLREIVDVTIVGMQETSSVAGAGASMDSDSQVSGGGGVPIPAAQSSEPSSYATALPLHHTTIESVLSYQTTESSSHLDPSSSIHHINLPHSPSRSDATSVWQRPPPPVPSAVLKADGWTLLHKTRPAAHAGHVSLETGDAEDETEHSFQGVINSSINNNKNNQTAKGLHLWNKYQVWDASISWDSGLRNDLIQQQERLLQQLKQEKSSIKGLRRKVESTLLTWQRKVQRSKQSSPMSVKQKFYLAYRRRQVPADDQPAVADLALYYMRLHRNLLIKSSTPKNNNNLFSTKSRNDGKSVVSGLPGLLLDGVFQSQAKHPELPVPEDSDERVSVEAFLTVPEGYDELSIPADYCVIRDPRQTPRGRSRLVTREAVRSVLLKDETIVSNEIAGIEAIDAASEASSNITHLDPDSLVPRLLEIPPESEDGSNFCYIPVLAVRRQRIGDEERYHEDAAIVDLTVTFIDGQGNIVPPDQSHDASEEDEEDDETSFRLLGRTKWKPSKGIDSTKLSSRRLRQQFGCPSILMRRNMPFGFADAAFATRVLDRFPKQNYKGIPLPEEELPMFCYPTGCRLHRARYSDGPLPQYYGFVVKNERGDNIYVSCVSFMEPLTTAKQDQLAAMSRKRRYTSLPHRRFCQIQETRRVKAEIHENGTNQSMDSDASTVAESNCLLTGFDDMTTFENKTIALVGRYPFWTAFRKFLLHLHLLSGSSSDLPLERYISHLLLSVPLPKAGGPTVLIPLQAISDPMVLCMPPEKDFPLLDLSYKPLFACLEIRTVVTIVLGMLALEKKVIVMSVRPSLVLDVCELLRSLLFPFDLCAPYVPRLTEPFKTSLDFPGAIFVGIHDDGSPTGLASNVRKELPEDSIVIDLDTGEINTFDDRTTVIKATWDILPKAPRKALIDELQALCNDAAIVDGQEAIDSQFDSAFDVGITEATDIGDFGVSHSKTKEPLDDRAVRDAFLRFFCNVLGGYERFLVVPDADFLISGNEWFESQGFLAQVSSEKRLYLSSLVGTQLFQSFIQKRTEASDIHCVLFDECMAEYHASPQPYGRLGDDAETVTCEDTQQPRMLYSLLVDQAAAFPVGYEHSGLPSNKSFDMHDAAGSFVLSKNSLSFSETTKESESMANEAGDQITLPGRLGLQDNMNYIYCIDGNPCFPHKLNEEYFLPREPESWIVELPKAQNPVLARSERELEDAERRRRMATSQRGLQQQRRCLWQLPKLMGSQFLGAWLLCIPAQVSQPQLSHEQQSKYLMRALGAIRLFRSKQRIVPDEAAYRALMVACGRTKSDRRVELVKLFGLLRSDGIFPSAVTLGQYTRALAEGYSKRTLATNGEEDIGVEVTESASRIGRLSIASLSEKTGSELESSLLSVDSSLAMLESHGKRWRLKYGTDRFAPQKNGEVDEKKKKNGRSWLPVVYSTSFAPILPQAKPFQVNHTIRLVAIWSRTRACSGCGYIPLDEEIQAGWDILGGEEEVAGAVACPRCDSLIVPMIGFRAFSLEEALCLTTGMDPSSDANEADFAQLPPQVTPVVSEPTTDGEIQYVAYRSPASVRKDLERYVEEYGEDVLDRDRLAQLDPELFYNFWWYCARFSVPLPLAVQTNDNGNYYHYVAFASWERLLAERGCTSGAKALSPMFDSGEVSSSCSTEGYADPFDDIPPLLSRFNLQGYYSSVWDHEDLSKLLVTLVEACDKRDFRAVIECALKCNQRRKEVHDGKTNDDSRSEVNYTTGYCQNSDGSPSCELDVYRTIMYLSKYQCTSAFHAFFPAEVKHPCKGYHYWCSMGSPSPIFDRLIHEGMRRLSKDLAMVTPVNDVSEVALGFRCVFGHLI